MGDATPTITSGVAAVGSDTPLSGAMRAASSLACSAEPEVVFESLVRQCAPLVCQGATATVSRLDGRIYATSWPAGAINRWPQSESVVTDFNGPASGDYAGFHGLVSLHFSHPDESDPFVTQLLVERALAMVERARLVEAVASRQASVDHLERALGSNREIGVAVGILMVNHRLTDRQAFDLLSRVSQRTNRKLRVIALEVAQAGAIELPSGVTVPEPGTGRPRRLTSVPTPAHG
jgi:hypothetical protein